MTDKEIDALLKQASRTPYEVDSALLDRVAGSIGKTLRPVRPMPPVWALSGGLVLICAAVAFAVAARLGLHGFQALGVWQRALIFPALALLICLAASASASERIPGSRRRSAPGLLLLAGSLALIALFAALFHDYRTDSFVSQGMVCLRAGLLAAIPAALAGWLLLRRGFAVNAGAAGLAAGTLAGLAGIAMLELHCPNFRAPHVMLWHTAVMPLAAGAGALLAWVARRKRT